jgi:hypothetical protein
MLVTAQMTGYPKSRRVKLKYAAEITMASSAVMSSYIFRANSVFDPDYTGTGHQPMLYDQWTNIYSHYTVLNARISLTPAPPGTSDTVPSWFGWNLSTTANDITTEFKTVESLLESPYSTPPMIYGKGTSNTGTGLRSLPAVVCKFDAKKYFGVKNITDGTGYSANTSTNPTQEAFFRLYVAPISDNFPSASHFLVEIIYDVLFKDPRIVGGS